MFGRFPAQMTGTSSALWAEFKMSERGTSLDGSGGEWEKVTGSTS